MSIVPLVKATVCGHSMDKARVLGDLQEIGCLHLVPLTPEGAAVNERGPSPEARDALKFLLSYPQKRHQVRDRSKFDAVAVQKRALEIRDRVETLGDERDFLRRRITDLRPWGEFRFPPLSERDNQRLWFYLVPHYQMKDVAATGLVWQVVGRDNQFSYVAVIAEQEPEGMPVPRTHTGSKALSELDQRLEEVELEIEDLQAERAGLTRWCRLLVESLDQLEDRAALFDAFLQTYDQSPLFAVQGWAPRERLTELQAYAEQGSVVVNIAEPAPEDQPPTLFHNTPQTSPGEALVSFYMTPAYRLWDPSSLVLFSFAFFFAMIISDAGYALLMAAGLGLGWKKMGASESGRSTRLMFAYLIAASVGWGVLVGSYFGLTPPEGSLLRALKVLDVNDMGTMMKLSIMIGALHLSYANLRDAWRLRPSSAALAPVGWAGIILGGLALWFGMDGMGPAGLLENSGYGAMGAGAVAVLFFTGAGSPFGPRLLAGIMAFTSLSKAFGDVLSYLRLFALGLASAALAVAFNGLAKQVMDGLPGVGLLLALLVLVIGHGLNIVLAIVSGFVHGLRLNLIEFFNWSIKDEGRPFRAFEKKEVAKWST